MKQETLYITDLRAKIAVLDRRLAFMSSNIDMNDPGNDADAYGIIDEIGELEARIEAENGDTSHGRDLSPFVAPYSYEVDMSW